MIRNIYINDFANFQQFKIEFTCYKQNKLSLSLLVGRNGSGKSSFLDAMFQIATHNLKKDIMEQETKTALEYSIKDDNQIIFTNLVNDIEKMPSIEKKQEKSWDRIVRFYTGATKRKSHLNTDSIFDVDVQKSKWLLPILVLTGNMQKNKGWDTVFELVSNKADKDIIKPTIIWIDSNQAFIEDEEDNDFSVFIKAGYLSRPNYSIKSSQKDNNGNNLIRHFWLVKELPTKTSKAGDFLLILDKIIQYYENKNYDEELVFNDCGFIYSYGNDEEADKFPDDFLSDGEHALLNRFALISMLQNTDERYLVLLDEPETHFNEYWKTEFLYLITDTLKNCKHDIFIATHSAMLATDAKKDEIHRFENRESGTIVYPTPINTYGVNVVDIGKTLFQMESDIGRRSQKEIEDKIKEGFERSNADELNLLLREVGPGEWRWKIRTAIKEIEQGNRCKNFEQK